MRKCSGQTFSFHQRRQFRAAQDSGQVVPGLHQVSQRRLFHGNPLRFARCAVAQRIPEGVEEAKLIHGTKMLFFLLPDLPARSRLLQFTPLEIRFTGKDDVIDAKQLVWLNASHLVEELLACCAIHMNLPGKITAYALIGLLQGLLWGLVLSFGYVRCRGFARFRRVELDEFGILIKNFNIDPFMTLFEKISTVAKEIYRADEVTADSKVRNQLKDWEAEGYGHFPICMAKTQYSFSTDPNLKGAPSGHSPNVREVRLSAGAEFIVAITGDIMTMPGLPRVPSAEAIHLDEEGLIQGLF